MSGAREYVVVHEYGVVPEMGAQVVHESTEWCTSREWCISTEWCTRGARDYVVVDACEWFTRLRSGAQDYVVVHESLTNMYNSSSGESSSLTNIQYVQ